MKFKVGDKVIFEVARDGLPRYSETNFDNGPTGIFARGVVYDITTYHYCVKYIINDSIGLGTCFFSKENHRYYRSEQWTYPGYVKLAKCECGAEATYGKNSNTHSRWCIMSGIDERKWLNGYEDEYLQGVLF